MIAREVRADSMGRNCGKRALMGLRRTRKVIFGVQSRRHCEVASGRGGAITC